MDELNYLNAELIETVMQRVEENINYEEVASRFWEKYEDSIYDLLVERVAETLFDLPF